jgi:hypothetical protein
MVVGDFSVDSLKKLAGTLDYDTMLSLLGNPEDPGDGATFYPSQNCSG